MRVRVGILDRLRRWRQQDLLIVCWHVEMEEREI